MRFGIMLETPWCDNEIEHVVPSYGAGEARPSMADRHSLWSWSRGRRPGRRRTVWLSATPRAGGLVLPSTCPAPSECAAQPPLAFAIKHPANRLTAGGTAILGLVAARLQGWFMAPRPVAQRR